jgi:hypothetical protein
VALNSPDRFPALALESGQHPAALAKGPWTRPFLRSSNPIRKDPGDNGFRREHNLALIGLGFQKVADPDSDLVARAAGLRLGIFS